VTAVGLDLLAVMAHPDDAELLCGGSLAKAAAAGRRVGVLDLTAGEMGSSGTPEIRLEEAARAASVLGVNLRLNAGLPDARIVVDPDSLSLLTGHLRKLRPRVVVTHWTTGRHPDHERTAELVRHASFLAGLRKYRPELGSAFRPHKLVHATAFREDADPPDFVVDISKHVEARMAAMAAYPSQFEGATGMGEVFPGGDRPIAEQVLAKLAHYGSLIRARYGEPFRAREALEVHDLAELRVSSF